MDLSPLYADIHSLVEEIGPRPAGSAAADHAAAFVLRRLEEMGWQASGRVDPGLGSSIWACNGRAERLFIAHTDSVHAQVPGAIDNAAGVALLLALAKDQPLHTCLLFPAAEELGLLGSKALAAEGLFQPRLVVALDLVGQGDLSVTGLGPSWGDDAIAWLAGAPLRQPYAYRVFSRLFPWMERSDHAAFLGPDVLSLQLLGRGPAGVFWAYHTAQDRMAQVEERALLDTLTALRWLAQKPLPPIGPPSAAFSAWGIPIPGFSAGIMAVIGLLLPWWPRPQSHWRSDLKQLAGGLLAGGLASLAWELARWGRDGGAALTPLLSLSALGAAGMALPPGASGAVMASRLLSLLSLYFLNVDVLLALPFAYSAAALRLSARWPLAFLPSLWVPVYLLERSREFQFHFVLNAGGTAHALFLALLLWPWLTASPDILKRPLLRGIALGLCLFGIIFSLLSAPYSDNFPERHPLRPEAP